MPRAADDLISRLFDGVFDKVGKTYVGHCRRVAASIQPAPDDETDAALLHDVIEDIPGYDGAKLRSLGFPERTVSLVEALSRPRGMAYMDWIRQIADSGDEWLIRIKLADICDNSDPSRIAGLPESDRSIIRRYGPARDILSAVLKRRGGA